MVQKGAFCKNDYSLEPWSLESFCNMSNRDPNTVELSNIPGFWNATDYEYVFVPNMPGQGS